MVCVSSFQWEMRSIKIVWMPWSVLCFIFLVGDAVNKNCMWIAIRRQFIHAHIILILICSRDTFTKCHTKVCSNFSSAYVVHLKWCYVITSCYCAPAAGMICKRKCLWIYLCILGENILQLDPCDCHPCKSTTLDNYIINACCMSHL